MTPRRLPNPLDAGDAGSPTASHGRTTNDAGAPVAVLLSLALSTFGVGISLTVITLVTADLTTSGVVIGVVVSARWLVRLVVNIPAGIAANRVGAWRVFYIGIVAVAVSALLTATSTTWSTLLLARLVEGTGATFSMTAGMALIAGVADPATRGRRFGHYQLGQRIGFWIGPLAGGLVAAAAGNRAALWGYAAVATLAIVPLATVRPLSRPPAAAPSTTFRSDLGTLMRSREFALVGLVTLIAFFTMTGMQYTALPVVVERQLDGGAALVGWAVFASNAVAFALVYPAGWASDHVSRRWTGAILLAVGAVGLLLMPAARTTPFLIGTSILVGALHVLRGPATQAYAIAAAGSVSTGAASALYRTLGDLGSAEGPLVAGAVLGLGIETLFVLNGLVALAVLTLFVLGTRPTIQLGVPA